MVSGILFGQFHAFSYITVAGMTESIGILKHHFLLIGKAVRGKKRKKERKKCRIMMTFLKYNAIIILCVYRRLESS